MGAVSAPAVALRVATQAIGLRRAFLRHPQAPNDRRWAGCTASGERRRLLVRVAARRSREEYERGDDYVAFDDEEDWEQQGTTVKPSSLGPVLSTALRGVRAISDRLTDLALQVAPADASPAVVRVSVNAGLVLLALSFVKSILSFFLTLGSIILGAYVAVKVFGIDVAGVSSSLGSGGDFGGSGGGSGGGARGGGGKSRSAGKRRPDPRARQSEFKGLLGSGGDQDDDGLLDVWFERKQSGGSKAGGSGGAKGQRRR